MLNNEKVISNKQNKMKDFMKKFKFLKIIKKKLVKFLL